MARPYVPIGQRRDRVTIQVASTSSDGMGGQAQTWTTVVEPWAQVVSLGGPKEALTGGAITAQHGYRVTIPYRAGMSPRMRIIVRDTTMEIHTVVDDDGRRRQLTLHVGEVQR